MPDKAQSSPFFMRVKIPEKAAGGRWVGGGVTSGLQKPWHRCLTFCPGEQSSSKAVINRGQGLGLRVEGQSLLGPGLGKPETNLGQD